MTILQRIYELQSEIKLAEARVKELSTEYATLLEEAQLSHITSDGEYEIHIPTKTSQPINANALRTLYPDLWNKHSYITAKDAEEIIGIQNLRNYVKTQFPEKYQFHAKIYVADMEKEFGKKTIPNDIVILKITEQKPIIRKISTT